MYFATHPNHSCGGRSTSHSDCAGTASRTDESVLEGTFHGLFHCLLCLTCSAFVVHRGHADKSGHPSIGANTNNAQARERIRSDGGTTRRIHGGRAKGGPCVGQGRYVEAEPLRSRVRCIVIACCTNIYFVRRLFAHNIATDHGGPSFPAPVLGGCQKSAPVASWLD